MKQTPSGPTDNPDQLREKYESALQQAMELHADFNEKKEELEESDDEERTGYWRENAKVEHALFQRAQLLKEQGVRTIEDVLPFIAERRMMAMTANQIAKEHMAGMLALRMAKPGEKVLVTREPDDYGHLSSEQSETWSDSLAPMLQEMGFELRPIYRGTRPDPSRAYWDKYVFVINYAKGMAGAKPEAGEHGLRGKLIENLGVYETAEDGSPDYNKPLASCEMGEWALACTDPKVQERIDMIAAALG